MHHTTALITGASGGIGREFAKLLAKDGYNLILVARNEEKLTEVKRELEGLYSIRAMIAPLDLAKQGAPEFLYRIVEQQGLAVDVLINNAGFGKLGKFAETDWTTNQNMIAVNMTSLTHLCRLLMPGMLERGRGNILNVASTAGFQPGPSMSVYYASKAYVLSFSQALAYELKGTGVRVTVLCPGPTATGFESSADLKGAKLFRLRKPASADDVARYGYEAMKKGKIVAVHGFLNKLTAFSVRFAPRPLLAAIVKSLHEK